MLFVGHLINIGRKSTTIRSYVSAIRAVLQNWKIKLKEDKLLLKSLTQACRIHYDTISNRLPIRKSLLHLILNATEKVFDPPQPYLTTLYQAMFSAAYYGLLRVGEITNSPHVIKAKDVQIGDNKDKIMFILHSSKTHGKGDKPQIIKIMSEALQNFSKVVQRDDHLCPFKLISDYLTTRKTYAQNSELFFIFRDSV